MAATKTTVGKAAANTEAVKQITYLATALKAPRITEAAARLADQARDAGWTHEDYLAAVLEREVSARHASGAQLRIRAAGCGAVKTLEDFDFDANPRTRYRQPAQHQHHHRRTRVLDCRQPLTFQTPEPPSFGAPSTSRCAADYGHRVVALAELVGFGSRSPAPCRRKQVTEPVRRRMCAHHAESDAIRASRSTGSKCTARAGHRPRSPSACRVATGAQRATDHLNNRDGTASREHNDQRDGS